MVAKRRIQSRQCKVEGCEAKPIARGLCGRHYAQWRNGKLKIAAELLYPVFEGIWESKKDMQKFIHRMTKKIPTECWEWQGFREEDGYGQYRTKGRLWPAHRLSAFAFKDFDLSNPLHVLHYCDNPPCCNPEHLWIGTNSDNVRDCCAKNRHPKGEESTKAKLTERDVREIKNLRGKEFQKDIAKRFGVSRLTISAILNGYNWKHI